MCDGAFKGITTRGRGGEISLLGRKQFCCVVRGRKSFSKRGAVLVWLILNLLNLRVDTSHRHALGAVRSSGHQSREELANALDCY